MTLPFWCLLIGLLLPYVCAGLSVPFRNKQFGNVDLNQPRVQGEQLVDGGARAWGAQSNAWEALIVFGVANLTAFSAGVDPGGYWSIAAIIWVVARVLHIVFYVGDKAPLRVFSFVVGLFMSLWIVGLAIVS